MNISHLIRLSCLAIICFCASSCYDGESIYDTIERLEQENLDMELRIAELLDSEENLEKKVATLEEEKEELETKITNLEDIVERAKGELEWNRDIEYAIDILNEWW